MTPPPIRGVWNLQARNLQSVGLYDPLHQTGCRIYDPPTPPPLSEGVWNLRPPPHLLVSPWQTANYTDCFSNRIFIYVSMQTTLTADEVIFHKICANDDIEAILGRFGPWEVRFYIINCTDFMQNQPISCQGHLWRHIYKIPAMFIFSSKAMHNDCKSYTKNRSFFVDTVHWLTAKKGVHQLRFFHFHCKNCLKKNEKN